MPAPIGNKNALGNKKPSGRPPFLFTDEELIEMGKQMLKDIEAHPDWLFIQEYAETKEMCLQDLYNLRDRVVFKHYYDRAKSILGARIVKTSGKTDDKGKFTGLHPSLANRFVHTYFKDVQETDIAMKKADNETKQFVLVKEKPFDESKPRKNKDPA